MSESGKSISTAQLNRPIKLTLSTPKGMLNLKVNIISNQVEPTTMSLVVPGSISVFQMRSQILEKLPQDMKKREQAQIVLSIKKKQLDDKKYLFETLYQIFNIDDQQQEGELPNRNQRMNNANLKHASQVDKLLVQYSRSHGYHKIISVQAMLKYKSLHKSSS